MAVCISVQPDPVSTMFFANQSLYSIGPLFIKEQFGIEEGIIGIIFSVGSAAGSLFTFAALSNKGREFQNKYARSPYNLYFLIILGTLSVLGLMIPNFPTQVAMIILVHIALEVGQTVSSTITVLLLHIDHPKDLLDAHDRVTRFHHPTTYLRSIRTRCSDVQKDSKHGDGIDRPYAL